MLNICISLHAVILFYMTLILNYLTIRIIRIFIFFLNTCPFVCFHRLRQEQKNSEKTFKRRIVSPERETGQLQRPRGRNRSSIGRRRATFTGRPMSTGYHGRRETWVRDVRARANADTHAKICDGLEKHEPAWWRPRILLITASTRDDLRHAPWKRTSDAHTRPETRVASPGVRF